MNIDFIAILNAALTESVGAMVTQQLALIVKPIEDMASKLHELTVRVPAGLHPRERRRYRLRREDPGAPARLHRRGA